MGAVNDLPAHLPASPCQSVCSWSLTGTHSDGVPVVECAGCGTQWTRREQWTPIDSDGIVPPAVVAEAARR